ncbi:hypothetical protein BELL_0436g00070 [Botrytis elliptica]|uniref:Uncharacterized protein n=1 Tax=Botrytis elliptica TaxID=278938 RepID=A0A4Z1JG04_9HELO|nr:hypothetical protein BELL_0436g00070 [Botrytis elliptica]
MPSGCKLQRDYPCSLAFKTSELCAFWWSSPHNQTNPVLLGGVELHGYWKYLATGDSRVVGGVFIPTEGLPRRPRKKH